MKRAKTILMISALLLTFIVTKQLNAMQSTEEIWKDIPGQEGNYQVSSIGGFRNFRTKKTIIQSKSKQGYYRMCCKYGKEIKIHSHRAVALAFIHNPQNKPQVNHINGIKTDNRVENLEWVTQSENALHAIKIGLLKPLPHRYDEAANCVKLTNMIVKEIRENFDSMSKSVMARKYNVSTKTIRLIVQRKTWKHI